MREKSQAQRVSQVFGCWWDGDISSKVVPTYAVVNAAGTPRQDSPRHIGGREMQLILGLKRGLQSSARLRLLWFSILVWKNLPVSSSQ